MSLRGLPMRNAKTQQSLGSDEPRTRLAEPGSTEPGMPLQYHPLCTTRDLDEAREKISALYYPHQLDTTPDQSLNVVLNAIVSPSMTIGCCRFGADTQIDVAAVDNCYHINVAAVGRSASYIRRERREITTDPGLHGAIFKPSDSVLVEWPAHTVQFALKLPAGPLHDHLAGLLGVPVRGPINFDPELDLSTLAGSRFASAIAYYASEVDRSKATMAPILQAQFENLIMTSLLAGSAHEYSDALADDSTPHRSATVKRALDYIHEHIAQPIGVTEIARASGVTARSLQAAFNRDFGSSPMVVVRGIRLTHAHKELCASDPETATVSGISTKWGFLHQGRFGHQYRLRYGRSPVQTLRNQV